MPRGTVTLFALAVAMLPLTAQAGPDIAAQVEALDQARITGPGEDAAGRSLTISRLELEMTEGRIFPVGTPDGVVGAFFIGEGRFRYTSADKHEWANFRGNVKRASGYEVKENAVAGSVPVFLLWGAEQAARLAGPDGWSDGDPDDDAQKRLKRFRASRDNDWGLETELYTAHALVESPATDAAMVELGAAKRDLLYVHDSLLFGDEELYALDLSDYRLDDLFRYLNELSIQPLGRERLEPRPPRFRLVDVDVVMTNPREERAELVIKETFEIFEPTRVLDLRLRSHFVGPPDLPYHLKSVRVVDGVPLPFVHRKGHLLVQLPEQSAKGDRVSIEFRTEGDVLQRPGGDNFWTLGTGSWLPTTARTDMELFTYHAVVKVPKPFIAFSNGKTERRWEEGGLACAEFREKHPIFLPVILAGKYATYEQSHEGLTVQVHSYAQKKLDRMKGLVNNVFAIRELYGKLLGEYPYDELKIIEINSLGFGQAPPGIIFITREAFVSGFAARGWSVGINHRVAHELAHTWWGNVSPWASSQDYWLCESTAEYYAAVAMGLLWKDKEFDDQLRDWRDETRFLKDTASVMLAGQMSGGEWWRDRRALLYAKGPLVLHALREEIGDQAFFTAFKTLLTNRRFQHITTTDAISVINHVTKRDYTAWMERYLMGTDSPGERKKGGKKKKKKG